jgi:hypothetical protein
MIHIARNLKNLEQLDILGSNFVNFESIEG